jgi:hypothetical protein
MSITNKMPNSLNLTQFGGFEKSQWTKVKKSGCKIWIIIMLYLYQI